MHQVEVSAEPDENRILIANNHNNRFVSHDRRTDRISG